MSNLITCQTCNKDFSINAEKCIHCGEPLPDAIPQLPNEAAKKIVDYFDLDPCYNVAMSENQITVEKYSVPPIASPLIKAFVWWLIMCACVLAGISVLGIDGGLLLAAIPMLLFLTFAGKTAINLFSRVFLNSQSTFRLLMEVSNVPIAVNTKHADRWAAELKYIKNNIGKIKISS